MLRCSRQHRVLALLTLATRCATAFVAPPPPSRARHADAAPRARSVRRASDGDDDEAARIAAFRAKLMAGGLDAVAKIDDAAADDDDGPTEWARPCDAPATGVVLIGKPDWFFAERPDKVTRAALARVGLAADAGARVPDERKEGLAPVVLLLDGEAPKGRGYSGVLMGRRSGYMMGDLKELRVTGFMLQPLWVGGPANAEPDAPPCPRTVGAPDDASTTGIVCVHPYAADTIPGGVPLTDDGLYAGGDWRTATTLVEKGLVNPFRFRLFAQATAWRPGELERELAEGAWRLAHVSTELLLKDRDRGARPLALDVLEALEQ